MVHLKKNPVNLSVLISRKKYMCEIPKGSLGNINEPLSLVENIAGVGKLPKQLNFNKYMSALTTSEL